MHSLNQWQEVQGYENWRRSKQLLRLLDPMEDSHYQPRSIFDQVLERTMVSTKQRLLFLVECPMARFLDGLSSANAPVETTSFLGENRPSSYTLDNSLFKEDSSV